MAAVYQHQLHAHHTHRSHPVRWALVILLVLAGLTVYGLRQLKSDTHITKAKTITKHLGTNDNTQTFREGYYTIALPKGWQFMSKQVDLYTIYHFRSALPGEDGNRMLDVYEDSNLPNFAENRMLPVTATPEGGLTTDASLVSDNCTQYTIGSLAGRPTVGAPAKWQGITFLCDVGNTLRNVVGTGSTDGLNTVIVKTVTSPPHHYFFTYTDNNSKPDFSIFTKALISFKLVQ